MARHSVLGEISAVLRNIDRKSQRKQRVRYRDLQASQRDRARLAKLEAKERELAEARDEVEMYESQIECLTTLHCEPSDDVDWRAIAETPEPPAPVRADGEERAARAVLEQYRPGFFDRLFGWGEAKRAKLVTAVDVARSRDDATYAAAMAAYNPIHAAWAEKREVAERVLAHDTDVFRDILASADVFSELKELGSEVRFDIKEGAPVHAFLKVHGETAVPREVKSLTKTGKLSSREMAASRFSEIYQDYVAGAALRLAAEVFALLPAEDVVVTAFDNLLDEATGFRNEAAILSVQIPRATLRALNLPEVDPSSSLKNFKHAMAFKKGEGFSPIVPINVTA